MRKKILWILIASLLLGGCAFGSKDDPAESEDVQSAQAEETEDEEAAKPATPVKERPKADTSEDAAEDAKEAPANGELPVYALDEAGSEAYLGTLYLLQEVHRGIREPAYMEQLGVYSVLQDYGWPHETDPDDVTYLLTDLDGDGQSELILLYQGEIVNIYGSDGYQANYAFGANSDSQISLYPGGVLANSYPMEGGAGTTWMMYDPELGRCFPAFEMLTEKGKEPTYYRYCYYDLSDEEREEVVSSYYTNGSIPVWVYEWDNVITKEEYSAMLPKGDVVELPEGEKLSDLVLTGEWETLSPIVSKVDLTDQMQYEANIFLSNFIEAGAYPISAYSNINDLVSFAHLYVKINAYQDLKYENDHETLTFEQVAKVLDRFFGIRLTKEMAQEFYNDDYATKEFYEDGKFYFISADGEAHTGLAIVNSINKLEDGTQEMLFDVYWADLDTYVYGDGDLKELYHLDASAAAKKNDMQWGKSGSAIVVPYQNNGRSTYRLIRMNVYN